VWLGQLVLDTEMLETSSWGECGNDDLPGNQSPFDKQSLYFDSDPLPKDLDVFGAPIVTLTVSADRPIAALAIRLNEVSAKTGASHLVCYRFCNLAARSGDLAAPERIEPGVPFSFRVVLNMMGHSFKRGWRIRLTLSPSFYPTPYARATSTSRCIWERGRTGGKRDHTARAASARR
jgi:predicted acyl esterase